MNRLLSVFVVGMASVAGAAGAATVTVVDTGVGPYFAGPTIGYMGQGYAVKFGVDQ